MLLFFPPKVYPVSVPGMEVSVRVPVMVLDTERSVLVPDVVRH